MIHSKTTVAALFSILLWQSYSFAETKLQSSYESSQHQLTSKILKRDFYLFVEGPSSQEKGKRYPTIYVLDGGMAFPMLAGYYRYLRLQDAVPEAFIVGIAYPGETFAQGNYRSTDYTAPSSDRDYWGGADKFQQVLKDEIFPLIENHYPADSDRRVLFGQSIGGQFVLYTAMTQPDLFSGYIASNPALHRNLETFKRPLKLGKATLFVTSAGQDDERFRKPALAWMSYIQSLDEKLQEPRLKTTSIPGHGHFSVAPEAFFQGLTWWLEHR